MQKDLVVVRGLHSHQTRDHQIAKSRMEVVLAMVVAIMPLERAGVGVQGFGQIRLPILSMALGVDPKHLDIILRSDRRGLRSLQNIR